MKSAWKASRMTILAVVLTGVPLLSIGKAESLDTVKGHNCYTYGDETPPAQAKKRALVLARERAAESYRVFITNSAKIENFQLKEDIIQSVSAELLQNVQIIKEEEKDRKICIDIEAEIDPTSAQEEITQRLHQRELIEKEKKIPLEKANPAFGLRIWVNKEDRQYEEGEHLIVYVQSEQDTYLKLDYCQADGTVVHMVPNMFREATIIQKGETYVFGGENSWNVS
jgi:hypothetical protein